MNTINNPDASIGEQCSMFRTVCSHKVVALGFNTLCYDAERRGIKPSARIKCPADSKSVKSFKTDFFCQHTSLKMLNSFQNYKIT